MKIEDTLKERGANYGEFKDQAIISQDIKGVMAATPGWDRLAPYQKEALEIIGHKVARILNGNPNFHDSWHDIVGYAKLVADRIQADQVKHD